MSEFCRYCYTHKKKVVKLVSNHMIPNVYYQNEVFKNQKITNGAIRKLAARLFPATIQELILLAEADNRGKQTADSMQKDKLFSNNKYLPGQWLLDRAKKLKVVKTEVADVTEAIEK